MQVGRGRASVLTNETPSPSEGQKSLRFLPLTYIVDRRDRCSAVVTWPGGARTSTGKYGRVVQRRTAEAGMSRPLNKARDASAQAPRRLPAEAPATPAETCDLCGSESV